MDLVTIDGVGNVVTTGETTGAVAGTATVDAKANAMLLSHSILGIAEGQVGTVIAGISVEFLTTGLASGTNVGNVTIEANADAIVTGVEATGDAGNVKVFDQVIPVQNPSFQPPVQDGFQPRRSVI